MKLYSRKYHQYVERKVHFGIGKSVKTACGLVLFSRHVMVSVYSDGDGAIITDNLEKVTCKRCLAIRDTKLRKLLTIENIAPGIFDRDSLCGEAWLLKKGLNVSRDTIEAQKLELLGERKISLSNKVKSKDRKVILRSFVRK